MSRFCDGKFDSVQCCGIGNQSLSNLLHTHKRVDLCGPGARNLLTCQAFPRSAKEFCPAVGFFHSSLALNSRCLTTLMPRFFCRLLTHDSRHFSAGADFSHSSRCPVRLTLANEKGEGEHQQSCQTGLGRGRRRGSWRGFCQKPFSQRLPEARPLSASQLLAVVLQDQTVSLPSEKVVSLIFSPAVRAVVGSAWASAPQHPISQAEFHIRS